MSSFRAIELAPRPAGALSALVGPERVRRFQAAGTALAEGLAGRTVWNVSLDESATGVGELVRSVLVYVSGFGIATRWLVVEPDAALREIVRRVRSGLKGLDDDSGRALGAAEHAVYDEALADPAQELADHVQPGDVVLLHDPGTAGLAHAALHRGAIVVWRCHGGSSARTDATERAWAFLQHYIEHVGGFVFSRHGFAPAWVDPERTSTITPSLDPLSPKNRPLADPVVRQILTWSGVLAGDVPAAPRALRHDGTEGPIRQRARVTSMQGPPPADARLVVQVTRWDPSKDMPGVMRGFAEHVDAGDTHLVLAGPDPAAPDADPIARLVFDECRRVWDALPDASRRRVHLATLPADTDESATVVNALQRHAAVVAQKCLAGDQSTAVAEAMLKARPIVASGVGGLTEQLRDGYSGLLVDDPHNLATFGAAITRVLSDDRLADRLRYNAYADAVERLLPDRHLLRWAGLVSKLLDP